MSCNINTMDNEFVKCYTSEYNNCITLDITRNTYISIYFIQQSLKKILEKKMFSDYLQDVIRCHICETPVPSLHCENCQIYLCSVCKAVHLSDKSKQHLLLAFRLKGTIPRCIKHSKRICEFHCEQCDINVCRTCLSSDKHKEHKIEDVLKTFALKTERIKKDLQELAECFLVKHKETSFHIKAKKPTFAEIYRK